MDMPIYWILSSVQVVAPAYVPVKRILRCEACMLSDAPEMSEKYAQPYWSSSGSQVQIDIVYREPENPFNGFVNPPER